MLFHGAMNRFIIAALLLATWLIRWSAAAAALPTGFTESVVAAGITSPTTMQFAPDGRLFVCQKDGKLRVIKNGLLLADPMVSLPVDPFNERGLLGIDFDPGFITNNFFYVYYTATNGPTHNRVSRFTADGDGSVPGSELILLELNNLNAGLHNGGALHFGPDGKLYIATGENGFGLNAQTLTNLLGKILRINPDGSIPTNNPFYGIATGVNRSIWAMGLRNPFTFAFQPGTGRLFINDVGEMTWEEINEGFAGANYGWPTCEGLCDPPNANYRNPLFQYGHLVDDPNVNGCAILGAAFFNPVSSAFPTNFLGSYFFADYCNGWIRNLNPASNTASLFATGLVAPVDLKVSAAGELFYLLRNAGEVRRIQFTNTPPNVTSQPMDQTVMAGESAAFTLSASGPTQLAYQWQRNSTNVPGATNTSLVLPSVILADNGSVFRCVVTNIFGCVTSNPALLIVTTNNNPTPVITLSAADGYYTAGDTITYTGSAPDLEDGFVQPASFIWTIVFHHATHTHPFIGPVIGVTNGSFTIPSLGEVSTNVWYRIELLVIDSLGGQGTTYLDLYPRTANLTLNSSPPGLRVSLDGQPANGPATIPAVVGMSRTLGVFSPQTLNGTNYEFEAWSDNGAIQHDITVPPTNAAYTAVYHYAGIVTNPQPPKLLLQPMSQQVLQGFPVDFNVIADGDLPMRFQWYFNATNLLVGATNAMLHVADSAQTVHAGVYSVVLTNIAGALTSQVATLTVLLPPVITLPPSNLVVTQGNNATFTVAATGAAPLRYQWYFNATNLLIGATNFTLTLTNTRPPQAGNYSVVVSNEVGSASSAPAALSVVLLPPTITGQPQSQTNTVGSLAAFTVSVGGSDPFGYQWFFNGTIPIAGATNATLLLPNLQTNQAGRYHAVVSNPVGSLASAPAVLTVFVPPLITTQPQNLTGTNGGNVTLSVTATALGAVTYQWRFNGTNLNGATNRTLTLNTINTNQAGGYSVVVANNPSGSVISPLLDTLIGYWKLDEATGTRFDSHGTNHLADVNGVGQAAGQLGNAALFSTANATVLSHAPNSDLGLGTNTPFTFSCWVYLNSKADYEGFILKRVTPQGINTEYQLYYSVLTDRFRFGITDGTHIGNVEADSLGPPAPNTWYFITFWHDPDSQTACIQVNNGPPDSMLWPYGTQPTAGPFSLGQAVPGFYFLDGRMDSVGFWKRVLTPAERADLFNNGAGKEYPFGSTVTSPSLLNTNDTSSVTSSVATLTVLVPPSIVTPPLGQSNIVGSSASFSVVAAGTAPLTYQWRLNGTNIVGATNATLNLFNLQLTDSGNYTVLVGNAAGFATSAPAALSINSGPAIQFDGVNDVVLVPDSPSLRITNTITVEAWIKRAVQGVQHSIAEKYGCPGAAPLLGGYVLRVTASDRLLFGSRDDCNTGSSVLGNLTLKAGVWYHVAGLWDGTNLQVYVNGSLDGTTLASRGPQPGNTPLKIGERGNGGTPFNGVLDEVRLWNTARTPADLLTNMNRRLTGAEAGLAGYWRLDEGTGLNAFDFSANGNTGTLVNGPLWVPSTAPVLWNLSVFSFPVSGATAAGATLNGAVNPGGAATTTFFQWGTTPAYGNTTPLLNAGNGSITLPISQSLGGLSQGTAYYYRLAAFNVSAGTNYGTNVTFTTPLLPVATAQATTAITGTNATLNGSVNPNANPTTAWFEWGLTESFGNVTPAPNPGNGTSDVPVSATINGLSPGTPLFYRLIASSLAGTNASASAMFTTPLPPDVVTQPASAISGLAATFNGSANPIGNAATAFFQWGTTLSYGNVTATQSIGGGSNAVNVAAALAGLSPGVTYHVRLMASNAGGVTPGADVNFTTPVFATAATQPASAITGSGGMLNGSINPNGYATAAWFQWGTTTFYGATTTPQNTGAGSNSVPLSDVLTGLIGATTYHYRIVASNAAGLSFGADATFTPPAPPSVTTQSALNITTNGATLAGLATPNFGATTVFFQWGAATNLNNQSAPQNIGSGTAAVSVNSALAGLIPGTTYSYRLVAQNIAGTNFGATATVRTLMLPSATTQPAGVLNGVAATLNGSANPNGYATTIYFEWGGTNYGNTTTAQSLGSGTNNIAVTGPLSGLTAGTTYHCRLVAYNVAGTNFGADSIFTTPAFATVITQPASGITGTGATLNSLVTPNGYATKACLQWGASTAYGNMTATQNIGAGSNAVPVTAALSGLTGATTYHFRAVATNAAGTNYGADLTFTPPAPPSLATEPATSITTNTATLTGQVTPNFGATTIYFEWGTTPGMGNLTAPQGVGNGTNALSVSQALNGLAPLTTISYRLVGYNIAGTNFGSTTSFITLGLPTLTTQPPTTVSGTAATLTGSANPNRSPTTAFFQWGATTNYNSLTAAQSIGSGTNALAISSALSGLAPATTYHYRLVAFNDAGTNFGADVSFTTPQFPAVSTQSAGDITGSSATLKSAINPNGYATTTYFEWGATAAYGNLTALQSAGSGSNAVPFTQGIGSLTGATTYHYRAVAFNVAGTNAGADVSFTPPAPPAVLTQPPTGVSTNVATFNGSVNPNFGATTAFFQWGATTNYASATPAQAFPAGTNSLAVSNGISGLTGGSIYHYRLVASNVAGTNFGADVSFTALSLPAVETRPATAVLGTSATINGSANAIGLPTTVYFQWGTTTNYNNATTPQDIGSGMADVPVASPIAGLIPGTTYFHRLVAFNVRGTNFGADLSFTTPVPPAVATLPFSAITGTSATLNGTVNPSGYDTTAFFQWGATINLGNVTAAQAFGSGSNALPLTASLSGLMPGATYYGRITAFSAGGTNVGATVSFTTPQAPLAATLPASSVASTIAMLNATVNPRAGDTTVYFQWGQTTNYDNATAPQSIGNDTNSVATPALLTNLSSGVTYNFRVVASNGVGTAIGANQVLVTIPQGPGFALQFDGVNDSVQVPDSPSIRITNALTMEAWVWRTAMGVQHSVMEKYGCPGAGSALGGYVLRVTASDKVLVGLRDDCNIGTSVIGTTTLKSNTWYHVAGVFDGTQIRIYINGALDGTVATTRAPQPGNTSLRIGERGNNGTSFKGVIDEVRLWKVARSAADLQASMNQSLTGNEAGLAGYWRFDEGTGLTTRDSSTNGNSGALVNGPVWVVSTAPILSRLSVATTAASAVTGASASLNGTVNPGGDPAAALFQWGATTAYGNSTTPQGVLPVLSAAPVTDAITGLAPGTTYHFRIVGFNSGTTNFGADQSFLTPSPPSVTTLAATDLTGFTATLNGSANPNRGATTAYFQWGTTTNYDNSTAAQGIGSGTNNVNVNSALAGLLPGTTYFFRLVAFNSVATNFGVNLSLTTPSAPGLVTLPATLITTTSATMNANANAGGAAAAAWFQWGTTTNYGNLTGPQAIGNGTANVAVGLPITGLAFGTTYHYRAVATNIVGTSVGGDQAFATPLPPAPAAAFTANPPNGYVPLTVNFSNQTAGVATNYNWTFGDGTVSTAANPAKIYTNAGFFTVSLTATGPGGATTVTRTNYIAITNVPPPVAAFTASPTNSFAPMTVNFSNQTLGVATNYTWIFGDGTSSSAASPAKTYANAGVYTVSLTAGGPGGTSSVTRVNFITVTNLPPAPVAAFTGSPTNGATGMIVNFANQTTGSVTNYAWNFGDGTASSAANPAKTYNNAGVFTVTLTATGPGGSTTATRASYITVTNLPPVANFTASPTTGLAPLLVSFNNQTTGAASSYSWNFGDATTSAAASPAKLYTNAGAYTVTLTATGPAGSGTITRTSYIVVTNPVPGYAGTGIQLDGVDDYMEVPDSPSVRITNTITVEAWIRRSAVGVQHSLIEKYGCAGAAPTVGGYTFRINANDKLAFYMEDDCNIGTGALGATSLAANTWYHVAGVWDGAEIIIYVNGVIDGITFTDRNPKAGNTPLKIGERGNGGTSFAGLLDEVRLWNVARTQAQIQASMSRILAGTESGLAGYWRFDEFTGTTVADLTGNGNNGTLLNGPLWVVSGAPLVPPTAGAPSGLAFSPAAAASDVLPSHLTVRSDPLNHGTLISLSAAPGSAQLIEASLDLTHWTPLLTIPVNAAGQFQFRDALTKSGTRFYRLSEVQNSGGKE